MKAYVNDNHDGRVSAMVAARTLPEAARKLGTTVGAMRTYGWFLAEGEERDLALGAPDTIFTRPIMGEGPWTSKGQARPVPQPASGNGR